MARALKTQIACNSGDLHLALVAGRSAIEQTVKIVVNGPDAFVMSVNVCSGGTPGHGISSTSPFSMRREVRQHQ